MPRPDAVVCKIFRASQHFKELEAETLRYYETNPARIVRQAAGDPDEFIGKLEGPIPARIPLIMGDCFQNLRSSLDYLVWELVLAANKTPSKDNMFPICSTREAFTVQLGRHRLEGVPTDAIEEIERLQPYHHGQHASKNMLQVLDDFCNINKHRRILLTRLHGGSLSKELTKREVGGETYALIDLAPMLQGEAKFGPFPIIDGPQGPGLKMDKKIQFIVFLAFNEGVAQNMHIGLVTGEIIKYVNNAVMPEFDRFFL